MEERRCKLIERRIGTQERRVGIIHKTTRHPNCHLGSFYGYSIFCDKKNTILPFLEDKFSDKYSFIWGAVTCSLCRKKAGRLTLDQIRISREKLDGDKVGTS